MACRISHSIGSSDWHTPLSRHSQGHDGHQLLSHASSFVRRDGSLRASNLSKLRFLAPIQGHNNLGTYLDRILDPFTDCACANYLAFTAADYLSETPSLVLTDPGALAGCKHYVAISYCWRQAEQDKRYDPGVLPPPHYDIHTSDGIRRNRAPASVIHRALIYAAAYGYRLLWIDQECINQEDAAEKSMAVQQMDLVYRQAAQTVAIFSSPFIHQAHLDAIGRIGVTRGMHRTSVTIPEDMLALRKEAAKFVHDNNGEPLYTIPRSPEEGRQCLVECAEILANDPWHRRAWTLQEFLVTIRPLHFLIPCHQTLQRPPWLNLRAPGHVILSEVFIQRCLSFWLPQPGEMGDALFQGLKERADRCKEVLLISPIYRLDGDGAQRPELARISAADACSLFMHRGLSEPYDLLAIVGNVCLYKTRLDTYRVRDSAVSLSIALWAQSLLNGDMSILLALNEKSLDMKRRLTKLRSVKFCHLGGSLAQALGDLAWAREPIEVSSPSSFICRIKSLRPSTTGIRITGTLWRFDSYLDFRKMPGFEAMCKRVREEGFVDRRHPSNSDAFWDILAYFCSSESPYLAKAVLSLFQPSSRVEISDQYLHRLIDERRQGGWCNSDSPRDIYDSYSTVDKIVRLVTHNQKLAFGVMESDAEKCSNHQPTYIFVNREIPMPLLFVPHRELVMSEWRSDTPSFLFACWVDKLERGSMPDCTDLRLGDCPRKLDISWGLDPISRTVLVCGALHHFSSCASQEYNLLDS